MPNYRNKNRNRNKNKQRNKQQQQQHQHQQKQKTEICKKETEESPPSTATTTAANSTPTKTFDHRIQTSPDPTASKEVAGASAISAEITVCTNDKSCELDESQNVQSLKKVPDVTTATTATTTTTTTTTATATATKTTTETNDTVLTEPSKCDNKSENKHGITANNKMGNEKSKINANQRAEERQNDSQSIVNKPITPPNTSALGKVIVHRIVCEDANNVKLKKAPENSNEVSAAVYATSESNIIESSSDNNQETVERETELKPQPQLVTKAQKVDISTEDSKQQQQSKVIVHKVITLDEETKPPTDSMQIAQEIAARDLLNHQQQVKVLIHQHDTLHDESSKKEEPKVTIEESEKEDPQPTIFKASEDSERKEEQDATPEIEVQQLISFKMEAAIPLPQQQQAKVIVHQILLEDKDELQPKITSPTMMEPIPGNALANASQIKIVEISDDSLSDLEELRSPVVSEAESSIEYSDENQKICESITEVSSTSSSPSSSSSFSGQSAQKQSRKQKRLALEHHFLPQMLNPRFLDSISEENSELSDNSENPLSRSASTDSATNCPLEGKHQKLNAKYPKSLLDFSQSHKSPTMKSRKSKVIREETKAVAVAARLQDTPHADQSCTLVHSCMSPEAEAAEVVFINSASSSITDLHDLELFENNHLSTLEINLDTDAKDIINNTKTAENICFDSLTQTHQTPLTSASAEKIAEFCPNQSNNLNNNNNNQIIINNSKFINNNTNQVQQRTPTDTTFETDTKLNRNSQIDSLYTASSSPANNQLVFAQIEEQISSVLSSIDEVAKQHTTTNTTNTTTLETSSSPSSTTTTSSLSSMKFLTNLSNTQTSPVTTTTTTTPPTTASASIIRSLETSSEESFNSKSNSSFCADNNAKTTRILSKDVTMNTVRDIINENTANSNGNKEQSAPHNGYVKLNYNNNNSFTPIPPPARGSPPPPPIPPPSLEHLKILSHDPCDNNSNLASSYSNSTSSYALPLLEKHIDYHNSHAQSQPQPHHDFTQSLKSALSQLTSSATRQESQDSHCSDSTNLSQCTAINMANNQSDTSDTAKASSLISDLKTNTNQQNLPHKDKQSVSVTDPKKLRLLCAETVASFPYGEVVLEELASVAQDIGESRAFKAVKLEESMPYPLPDLPHIDDLQLSLKVSKSVPDRPLQPLQQSDQSWLGVPTSNDPKVLVCLSPSQRSYIQQKPEQKPDDLLDAHQKFVERRGYHEYTKEQLHMLEKEKLAEQQLLQTAAIMKKLRKSITPPPPQIPPPPVPVKSSETASKAQNLSKRSTTAITSNNTQVPDTDVSLRNESEHVPAEFRGENNGEENKHRLLTIMQDTNESNEPNGQNCSIASSSSLSYENNSRQTTNCSNNPAKEQVPSTLSKVISNKSKEFFSSNDRQATANMQSVETSLGKMFPTMGTTNIFEHKRFSNIESSNAEPFCSQILNTQPKRYSSIETHSYESKKLTENGKVLEDFSTTKHESKSSGDKPDDFNKFPSKTSDDQASNSFSPKQKEPAKLTNYQNDQEIMSALNLNKQSSDIEKKQQKHETTSSPSNEKTTRSSSTKEISHQIVIEDENKSAKMAENNFAKQTQPEYEIPKSSMQDTYEEFRQRAKAAADGVSTSTSTLPTLNSPSAKVTSNGEKHVESFSSSEMTTEVNKTTKSLTSHGHEKLFKEFDDLSKQLHKELEHSKVAREQREKSASMFDLNKMHMRQKQQIEEFNKSRYEHLKELEQEIERSIRSRSSKPSRPQPPASADVVDHQTNHAYEIPIQMENGNSARQDQEAPPIPKHPKTYQIPIHIEYDSSSATEDQRFRRAESMFNLNDEVPQRQRTYSNQTHYQRAEDDWSKYASDLGSSENIARPFAKEVEICYQRRPGGIKAPRLTVSTNDLSNHQTYDQYNAYNVRKHHQAPMLNSAPAQSRPKYGSCYSMIERDPNPKYISTTTRRGASPAPQSTGYFPLEGCHVREEDMRQRRASLPRELHEQQLKYIASKEDELRTEFERLQTERRRLLEEAQRAQAMQLNQAPTSASAPSRPIRESYRQTQKLPTLTEDEVFRQQMAEEWLNKVAEREKRRLQNIIKISKIHEDELASKHKSDMGEEFLSRVKERRHKLAMPADSDWESGAESQPTLQAPLSEAEDVPSVKILEGEQEASLRHLPRHLKEFAKFSNHQKANIEGGHREQHQEEERSEETTGNTVSKAFKKSSVVKTVKTLRAPMLAQQHGHENDNDGYRNVYEHYDPDGVHDIDVSALNRNSFESESGFSSINPRSAEPLTQFPGSFDEMFGKSPFRGRIFEEFNNYWRNFHNTNNNF